MLVLNIRGVMLRFVIGGGGGGGGVGVGVGGGRCRCVGIGHHINMPRTCHVSQPIFCFLSINRLLKIKIKTKTNYYYYYY